MGRRRRDGQRRAAKVEARRRRREAMARPRRSGHGPAGVAPATSRTPRVAATGSRSSSRAPGGARTTSGTTSRTTTTSGTSSTTTWRTTSTTSPVRSRRSRTGSVSWWRRRSSGATPRSPARFVVGTPHDEAQPVPGRPDTDRPGRRVVAAQGPAAALGPRPGPPRRHLGRRAPGRDGAGRGGRRACARPGGRGGEPGELPADTARRHRRPDLAARRGRRAGPGARSRADRRPERRPTTSTAVRWGPCDTWDRARIRATRRAPGGEQRGRVEGSGRGVAVGGRG